MPDTTEEFSHENVKSEISDDKRSRPDTPPVPGDPSEKPEDYLKRLATEEENEFVGRKNVDGVAEYDAFKVEAKIPDTDERTQRKFKGQGKDHRRALERRGA